jgi:hypothetical protein
MSETREVQWQPARLVKAHDGFRAFRAPIPREQVQEIRKKVIRVRERVVSPRVESDYRRMGCDATRFFELNQDDMGWYDWRPVMVCEHEILTD